MRLSLSLILLLAGAALAAPAAAQPGRGLFVSPAGEPFRRGDGGLPPMQAWFAQADADRDGALVWTEFEADFARWFAQLDTDHDGEIAPAEVERYEVQLLPEMRTGAAAGRFGPGARMGGRRSMQQGDRRGGGGMAGRLAMMGGAARFGLLPIAHPVMDADTNFNRGVSREEFAQAAARRFAMLNTQNNGRLTLEQLNEAARQGFDSGRRDAPGLGPAEPRESEPSEGD